MMSRTIDNIFKGVASDHVRVMDLDMVPFMSRYKNQNKKKTHKDTPKVDCNKENKVKHSMHWEEEDE